MARIASAKALKLSGEFKIEALDGSDWREGSVIRDKVCFYSHVASKA